MTSKGTVLSIVFTVLICGALSADPKYAEKRSPNDLNVKEPLLKLIAALQNVKLDIMKMLKLIIDVIYDCLLPTLVPPTTALKNNYQQLYLQLNDSQLQQIAEALQNLEIAPIQNAVTKNAGSFCAIPGFKLIHDFIWKEPGQLADLVHFLGRFGFPEIYDMIKNAYEADPENCDPEWKEDLPKDPGSEAIKQVGGRRKMVNVREQILQSRKATLLQEEEGPTCNLIDIISRIPETGLIQLLQFIETVMYEFNTNHNLHFLIGKLQEPIKGESVRKFRCLPPVVGILDSIHKNLTEDDEWALLFTIIKEAVGVDFFNINPFDFLISLGEFALWGTVFPDPNLMCT